MFEQATLSNGPASKRAWTTFAGIASQVVVVAGLIISPMLFPQILPKPQLTVPSVFSAVRRGRPEVKPAEAHITLVHPVQPMRANVLYAPPLKRENWRYSGPEVEDAGPPIVGSFIGDPNGNSEIGVPGSIVGVPTRASAPPPRVVEEAVHAPTPVQSEHVRVAAPSAVQMAKLIHRIDPLYPPMAKMAHVSGTVELEGIVGADGRMIDLRIKSGHPLLTKAAYDAVIQWVYQPTLLNGKPVEVIAPITVNFKLN